MSLFKNFKSVTYCVAQWADRISEEQLRKEADWLQKYVGIDKVYLGKRSAAHPLEVGHRAVHNLKVRELF